MKAGELVNSMKLFIYLAIKKINSITSDPFYDPEIEIDEEKAQMLANVLSNILGDDAEFDSEIQLFIDDLLKKISMSK